MGNEIKDNFIWIKNNYSNYIGKWVALSNGELLGVNSSRIILRNELKEKNLLKDSTFFRLDGG